MAVSGSRRIGNNYQIFRCCNSTGVEISIFIFLFEWPLQKCSTTALPVISLYLSAGNEVAMTNSKFHWSNLDAIRLQRLTSEELTISHRLATIVTGGDNKDVTGIMDSFMCALDLFCGNCKHNSK